MLREKEMRREECKLKGEVYLGRRGEWLQGESKFTSRRIRVKGLAEAIDTLKKAVFITV